MHSKTFDLRIRDTTGENKIEDFLNRQGPQH